MKKKVLSSFFLFVIIIGFFVSSIQFSSSLPPSKSRLADNGRWYLHAEYDKSLKYMIWSSYEPDNSEPVNITFKTEKSGVYPVGSWISVITSMETFSLAGPHNWLARIFAIGTKATLFYTLSLYNGLVETEPFFTSTESSQLSNEKAFVCYSWQSLDHSASHILSSKSQLVVRLYLNTSVQNTIYTIGLDYKNDDPEASVNTPSSITDPTETRYFTPTSKTANGLTARWLQTSSTSIQTQAYQTDFQYTVTNGSGPATGYWGSRVWIRHANETETEVTSGAPIAIVSFATASSTWKSSTWSCPSTTMASTDSVVLRLYGNITSVSGWEQLNAGGVMLNFTTEQLLAGNLDAATWTIYYNIRIVRIGVSPLYVYSYYYYFDVYTNPDLLSEIDNFQWTGATNTVVQNTPTSGSSDTVPSINFTYTPYIYAGTIQNATLYLWNSSSGALFSNSNYNGSIIANQALNGIVHSFANDPFIVSFTILWNVYVGLTNYSIIKAVANFTFTISDAGNPTYENFATNLTTVDSSTFNGTAGQTYSFSILYNDDFNVSHIYFFSNNTGQMVQTDVTATSRYNSTAVWGNTTMTLNTTASISQFYYRGDDFHYWTGSTITYTINIISAAHQYTVALSFSASVSFSEVERAAYKEATAFSTSVAFSTAEKTAYAIVEPFTSNTQFSIYENTNYHVVDSFATSIVFDLSLRKGMFVSLFFSTSASFDLAPRTNFHVALPFVSTNTFDLNIFVPSLPPVVVWHFPFIWIIMALFLAACSCLAVLKYGVGRKDINSQEENEES